MRRVSTGHATFKPTAHFADAGMSLQHTLPRKLQHTLQHTLQDAQHTLQDAQQALQHQQPMLQMRSVLQCVAMWCSVLQCASGVY